MEAAMDLMRRISPKESETALSTLLSLLPHHSADLLSQVDLPLQVLPSRLLIHLRLPLPGSELVSLHVSVAFGRPYPFVFVDSIACSSRRSSLSIDFHCLILICRSPWSNKYFPPLEDGPLPSAQLRKLEIEANEVFTVYRDQ
ncbi:hypothetical protein GW17_00002344 [Ensete ventricosum]|nr:hypothetical protein GW17_00002344 [Ensete ventricosum]RZR79660.1 hypothetical protein BHM03_00005450 [Ensete ventricosum]